MKHRAFRPDVAMLELRDVPSGGWWSSLQKAFGFGNASTSTHAKHAGHHPHQGVHARELAHGAGLAAHPHSGAHRSLPPHQGGHGK